MCARVTKWCVQAETLVLKEFPQKIIVLDELLKTAQFNLKDLSEVHQALNVPVPEPVLINRLVLHFKPRDVTPANFLVE